MRHQNENNPIYCMIEETQKKISNKILFAVVDSALLYAAI